MISLIVALVAAPQLGDLSQYPNMRQFNDLPHDVRVFIDRRMGCNHFAGESVEGDPERAREIEKAYRDLKCRSLVQDEGRLQKRYVTTPRVLKALEETRDDIW